MRLRPSDPRLDAEMPLLFKEIALLHHSTFLFSAPSPPRNITLLVKTSRSILVSWKEPEKKNGKITAYIISYGKGGLEAKVNTTKTKYLLDGLEEFTLYSVRVTAKTSILGNHSGIQKARTMEDGKISLSLNNILICNCYSIIFFLCMGVSWIV